MNLKALIDARVNPARVQAVLRRRFEVDVNESLLAGWFDLDCYDDQERRRLTVRFIWTTIGWLYVVLPGERQQKSRQQVQLLTARV